MAEAEDEGGGRGVGLEGELAARAAAAEVDGTRIAAERERCLGRYEGLHGERIGRALVHVLALGAEDDEAVVPHVEGELVERHLAP